MAWVDKEWIDRVSSAPLHENAPTAESGRDVSDLLCSGCGNRLGKSPYTCANGEKHAFCFECADALVARPFGLRGCGLTCAYCDDSSLVN